MRSWTGLHAPPYPPGIITILMELRLEPGNYARIRLMFDRYEEKSIAGFLASR